MTLTDEPTSPLETTLQEPAPALSYFALLLERIEDGSEEAVHELQLHYFRGIRYLLARHLGPDRAYHLAQKVFATVIVAIRNGEIRQPERLAGFVRTAVHRTIDSETDRQATKAGSDVNRATDLATAERVLRAIPSKEREALIRFYYEEEPAETICRELGLTPAHFRAIRNRAKDKFSHR